MTRFATRAHGVVVEETALEARKSYLPRDMTDTLYVFCNIESNPCRCD